MTAAEIAQRLDAKLPQRTGVPLLSITKDATGQPFKSLTPAQVFDRFRTGPHGPLVAKIRETYARVLAETGDPKQAKAAVAADKKKLPGILWSGTFTKRGDKNLETYSQLLCADVDDLPLDRVNTVLSLLVSDPH